MTHLNGSAKVVPIRPLVVRAKAKQPTEWRHHLTALFIPLLVVLATVGLVIFASTVIVSLLITGAFFLAFAVVVGMIGWTIRRLP